MIWRDSLWSLPIKEDHHVARQNTLQASSQPDLREGWGGLAIGWPIESGSDITLVLYGSIANVSYYVFRLTLELHEKV